MQCRAIPQTRQFSLQIPRRTVLLDVCRQVGLEVRVVLGADAVARALRGSINPFEDRRDACELLEFRPSKFRCGQISCGCCIPKMYCVTSDRERGNSLESSFFQLK